MDGISYLLPQEIIEIEILSRLPVKSLLRFKSVCPHWNATISDPKFVQTHLEISTKSSSSSLSCLLADAYDIRGHKVVTLEGGASIPRVSVLEYPTPETRLLCHCNGLYVGVVGGSEYSLWNPSRRSCKELNRYTFHPVHLRCGICYDPSQNEYKVVMADEKHYAVFYCGRNDWSDLREMNPNLSLRCATSEFCKN